MPDHEATAIEYHRDGAGTLFAVELIEAAAWRAEFLDPPDRGTADVRVVRLRSDGAPAAQPGWLLVEQASVGVAEPEATYVVDGGAIAGARVRQLWVASPNWRPLRAGLGDYLGAARAAIGSPEEVPPDLVASATDAIEALRRFATELGATGDRQEGSEPWSTLAITDGAAAVERWLQLSFDDPDGLADAVLVERLNSDGESTAVALLRYLRGARILEEDPELVELAVDRRALLEQATPWRHYERGDLAAAFPAVRAWIVRYDTAYGRWYGVAIEELESTRQALAAAASQVDMLERLDRVEALGTPDSDEATGRLARAIATIDRLPPAAEPIAPTTAGLALGGRFEVEAEAEAALSGVSVAADRRLRRLASALASLVMGRTDVEPLDRVLQALLASDVDDLDRVLNASVLAQIEELLGGAPTTAGPLERLAARYPEVTADTLNEVVAAFRGALEDALAAAPDGRAVRLT